MACAALKRNKISNEISWFRLYSQHIFWCFWNYFIFSCYILQVLLHAFRFQNLPIWKLLRPAVKWQRATIRIFSLILFALDCVRLLMDVFGIKLEIDYDPKALGSMHHNITAKMKWKKLTINLFHNKKLPKKIIFFGSKIMKCCPQHTLRSLQRVTVITKKIIFIKFIFTVWIGMPGYNRGISRAKKVIRYFINCVSTFKQNHYIVCKVGDVYIQ